MKHRILLLLSCIFFLQGVLKAQDLEPGQQARGYLDSKNMMVDYVTGIFHYKIPLFTLGSGDFQLPISLNYSAKGVKQEDVCGLIGYNWLLNTGGVVTRTIRGGIADETSFYGFLWAERGLNTTPLVDDVKRVNKRERDGESDIFTAVFNGQSVNFIIKMDDSARIYAEPLERTNVRIECESSYGREINGWIITDESGNRFIYRQKEWSVNIVKEDAISFNGIRDKSYISSWYLNRIEPRNRKPIVFTYLAEVRENEKDQKGINTVRFYSGYKSKYTYGRSMRERVFDFSKYRNKFDEAIREARDCLNGFSLEMQLNNDLYTYIGSGQWIRNPNFEAGAAAINANFRIMGQLANFSSVTNASNGLIQTLNQLIDTYEKQSSHNARTAASWFRTAKSYVIQSLNEVNNNVTTKETSGGTVFSVKSPILQSIMCDGESVEFEYYLLWGETRLKRVKLTDVLKRTISQVLLNAGDNLNYLSFLDKEETEINRIKFDYYARPLGIATISDAWGYLRERRGDDDNGYYFLFPDIEYSKTGSLKTITVRSGGKVTVDYEPYSLRYPYDFGGIRVKSLLVEDIKSETCDTVYYRYPTHGVPVFTDCSNTEIISYSGFSDRVSHSRVKYQNMAFMNTGNNGLFYPYVQEITRGKGTKAYLFSVVSPVNPNFPHVFWLTGLPLAVATYDNNGNLKQIETCKYSSDLSAGGAGPFFVPVDTALNYKKVLPQVKAYEYYMDEEFLESYYRNQGSIFLYNDGNVYYSLSPYNETYLPNIQPRTSVRIPRQIYNIKYGGKTLLTERNVYRFETHVTDSATISDFSKATGTPYQKTEFFYDNLKGASYPTRVIQTDARGETYTVVTKRVTEMEDAASPVVAEMKRKNILTPVVKEIHLKNDTIQVEKVSFYESVEMENVFYSGLSRKYAFYPTSTKTLSLSMLSSLDASSFTQGQANYLLEQTIDYVQSNQSYLPVGVQSNAGDEALCYDFNYGQVILKAKHATSRMVAAADLKKYGEEYSLRNKVSRMLGVYGLSSELYDVCQGIDLSQQTSEFRQYYWSSGHRMMLDLIGGLASKKSMTVEEYNVLIDSVQANRGRHVNDFRSKYMQLPREYLELTNLPELLYNMYYLVEQGVIRDPDLFKYRDLAGLSEYLNYTGTIKITVIPESKRLRLFVLNNGAVGSVYYSVGHAGGSSSSSVRLTATPGYSVQSFEIDLSPYENVASVTVSKPYENVQYVALLPADVSFEAISYNLDGSVFCKFDQNGRAELNEYDAAGRLIRVVDERGNVVRDYQYNVVKLN